MNLADLTNYVCTLSQLVEDDDKTACALFLSKRYELIYNSYLWKDSLGITEVSFNPSTNLDNSDGVIYLPAQVDRVCGLRTSCQSVRIIGLEDSFRIDYDRFNKWSMSGSPQEFSILSPDWLEVRPNPASVTNLIPPTALNNGIGQYYVIQQLKPGNTYVLTCQVVPVGAGGEIVCGTYGGPGIINGPAVLPCLAGVPLTFVANGDSVLIWNLTLPNAFPQATLQAFNPASPVQSIGPGATVTLTSDNQEDITGTEAVQIKVTWRDKFERYVVTSGLPATLTPVDGQGQIEIESMFKPVTAGNLTATVNNPFGGGSVPVLAGSIPPAVLRSPSFQRIRVFPKPSTPSFLWVLFKKPFTPLNFPTEEPGLRNLDNCLIAFAMGDMLKRSRQFGKAQGQYQEAAALLTELAKIETIQAANNVQFKPEGGYGDPFFAPSSNRGLWF